MRKWNYYIFDSRGNSMGFYTPEAVEEWITRHRDELGLEIRVFKLTKEFDKEVPGT